MAKADTEEKMLERLTEIKDLLTPKPAPPPPPPAKKSFSDEFMDFLNKYGVLGLAVGFIIGGAAGALVSALVGDILMPIITLFLPGGDWRTAFIPIGTQQIKYGDFFGVLINFIIIALIVFLLARMLTKTKLK
jgi:large conductance mechanosensitive channel